ncbi:MAG TPA: nitrite reductase large subunit NirB [Steroidobacteraceae bacterium]
MSKRIVVVGHGMVGQRFLETLTEGSRDFSITTLAEEPRLAYDRVNLSKYFSGSTVEDLTLTTREFFDKNGIELHSGDPVSSIDRANRRVTTKSGAEYEYDVLILATGSSPFVPPIPGRERPGVFVYRTIEDLEAISEAGRNSTRGVVIGGGLLGLEAAKALKDLGLTTHVVEFAPRLMAVQVDEGGGGLLRSRIEALGVQVHTGKNTTRIDDGEAARHRMVFADGGYLETDVIVISAGIRPRDELARACGLEVAPRGGIVIDGDCRTSDPDIYAIGECAAFDGRIFGLVAPGYQMARIAAARLLGKEEAAFAGADMSTKLKLLGVEVGSIGDAHGTTPGARVYSFFDQRKEVYKKLVVDAEGKTLIGAVLVGDTSDYSMWHQSVMNALALPENPETMLFPAAAAGASAPPSNALAALPASAQVCSCNNVSKGGICAAIEAGCTTVGALKTRTKAGTSCGGCTPLVTQLLNAELKKRGVSVNTSMCEHFPYTRQQLFHLVRVGELKQFDDVLAKHGKGLGCDICKPAVASILASCWNEFVLKKRHAALQDTNDYFLANMQKDGTYSVVPRVPGGEITPDGLIAIGAIAKKYGLYTKITGGQRIDMFGAQVHELPQIWKELIAAGFESGHAYGKALRTVKSCVGSTWCRYGVQDSVGLAINLENRYKGLRAPHKIKFAVSGCTRECAEAQGKDVGVIATEGGWNLYVSGNGGMKPRHADLLARDLDTPTLIQYIDRYLMFYIRTADRLQRTSTWLENLEGGIEYVRKVVCEDSLGIAAELEADMARVIANYACEWKAAVDDPQTLKRFRHFVNSENRDTNVLFVEERGQIRPANTEERTLAAAKPATEEVAA